MSLEKLSTFRDLTMISIHDEEIYKHFSILNKDDCLEEVHLLLDENNVLKGSDALEHLLKQNKLVSKFAWLIESDKGQKTIDYFYSMANKYRETIAKKCPSCHNKGHR
jgi:hypothetical protein